MGDLAAPYHLTSPSAMSCVSLISLIHGPTRIECESRGPRKTICKIYYTVLNDKGMLKELDNSQGC